MTIVANRASAATGAAVAALIALAGAVPAEAEPIISSSATGIDAQFTVDAIGTELGPIVTVTGQVPDAYDESAHVGKVLDYLVIAPGPRPNPGLVVAASGVYAHVVSKGTKAVSVTTTGEASVGTLALSLQKVPPLSPLGLGKGLYLTVVAKKVASSSSFTQVFPKIRLGNGSASFGSLSITGPLVDGKVLEFSGTAPKNKVLFKSATVKITLNKQKTIGLIACYPTCGLTPAGVVTDALAIHLEDADLGGELVSGDIVIATASAGSREPKTKAPEPMAGQ